MTLTQVRWNGRQVAAGAQKGLSAGLERAAAELLAASERIVPYEKGDLARSGDSGLVDANRAAVTYSDGGAIAAHERLNVKPANGRERKYLEGPLNRMSDELARTIARSVKSGIGA